MHEITPAMMDIVENIIAEAWDDGFEHCRTAAIILCSAHGRPDIAELIRNIPLKKEDNRGPFPIR